MKVKKLTLAFSRNPDGFMRTGADAVPLPYRISKVVDTIEYAPGDLLSKSTVESLCNKPGWSITIIPTVERL